MLHQHDGNFFADIFHNLLPTFPAPRLVWGAWRWGTKVQLALASSKSLPSLLMQPKPGFLSRLFQFCVSHGWSIFTVTPHASQICLQLTEPACVRVDTCAKWTPRAQGLFASSPRSLSRCRQPQRVRCRNAVRLFRCRSALPKPIGEGPQSAQRRKTARRI